MRFLKLHPSLVDMCGTKESKNLCRLNMKSIMFKLKPKRLVFVHDILFSIRKVCLEKTEAGQVLRVFGQYA